MREALRESLREALWKALRKSLWKSLRKALRESLGEGGVASLLVLRRVLSQVRRGSSTVESLRALSGALLSHVLLPVSVGDSLGLSVLALDL